MTADRGPSRFTEFLETGDQISHYRMEDVSAVLVRPRGLMIVLRSGRMLSQDMYDDDSPDAVAREIIKDIDSHLYDMEEAAQAAAKRPARG
jgi:hypothetical protein